MGKRIAQRWTEADLLTIQQPRVPGDEKPWSTGDKPLLESEIQKMVLTTLEMHPQMALVWRMNTGSGFLISNKDWKSLLAGAVAKAVMCRFIRFAFPGCSDILGMLKGGRFFACEVKTATGTVKPDQAAFMSKVNQFGGLAFVARSVDDVLKHLPLR